MGNTDSAGVKTNPVRFKTHDERLRAALADFDFEEVADQFAAPDSTPVSRSSGSAKGKAGSQYIDDKGNFSQALINNLQQLNHNLGKRPPDPRYKTVNVCFEDDHIAISIPIRIRSDDLTVGWLFSEVQRHYNRYIEHVNARGKRIAKRLMIALKSEERVPTLDYFLTDMAK